MADPANVSLITLGAATVAAISPIVSLIVSSRLRRREKSEDYARQDVVAAQAAQAAALLLAAQANTSAQNEQTQKQLGQIHTLVNSNLTREMMDRLVALKGQAFLSKELIRLNKLNHLEPSEETKASLLALETTIGNLETALNERGTATKDANRG